MVILIVDDQTNVVSGLISGINWDRLQVTKVLKAYNAFEARNILEKQAVDIILCDIEMPEEDGLSLLRWVKKNKLDIECILLTAHADFMYAKEAMQLEIFDYIIQPARYEDIEASIVRAKQKMDQNKKRQEYSSYGQILFEKKDKLIDSILCDWFYGRETKIDNILEDYQKLNIKIERNHRMYLVLFNILRWNPQRIPWEASLFKASMMNIITELYEHYGQKVLLSELDKDNYVFILYNINNQLIDEEGLLRQLEYFIQVCKNFFLCNISCYTGKEIHPDELSGKAKQLLKMRDDNVALTSKVFFDKRVEQRKEETHENYSMKRWGHLLVNGGIRSVREEILSYLENLSFMEKLDSEGLKRFYQSFLQMLFHASEQLNISLHIMFQDKEFLDKSLNSYSSVDKMYDFINLSMDYFEQVTTADIDTKNQIDLIIQYIHNNIEKDIRRNELAEAVFLNSDYMSRLFKKEVGVPLKEYIMLCKMKEAQVLLKTTNLPISMIAVKVGYTNFSHFSQVYKKMIGVTPAEDRIN